MGKFIGDEGRWYEWSLEFRPTIKECDDVVWFPALEMAGESDIEVTKTHVESISMDRLLAKVSDALQSL